MTTNNRLALLVAYYLSRCDKDAYTRLGYSSFRQAVISIGGILKVKPNTVKNMRDEFDPYHENSRIGWQRDLRGSRLKVLIGFQAIDDDTLFEIVNDILTDKNFKNTEKYLEINKVLSDRKADRINRASIFILRGPTGKKAESAFIDYFNRTGYPVRGELVDRRDEGCGYDFEVRDGSDAYFIEIKGLATGSGGVLFTNKEWKTALKYTDKYYLILIKNISTVPEVIVIKNPSAKLKAKKNIPTTIQVNWSISESNLSLG
jgi:hypothetical protein